MEETTKNIEKKILIVDDVETNRFVLRNIISEMGHKPLLAENGIQALKIMERISPNLILLDVAMPQMDGYELCNIIKADPVKRNIPIVFISAFDKPEDVVKGFQLGGADYITKPFIKEVVQSRVNVHMNLADANKNLKEANRRLASSLQEQLKQMEQEKKNVLYALVSVARENACYEEKHILPKSSADDVKKFESVNDSMFVREVYYHSAWEKLRLV